MAPQFPNPNWPNLFAEGNFGNNPFYMPAATQTFTDLTPRLQKTWSLRRGKQFELDQVQPGEFHSEWANKDGFLDPTNTSSPMNGNVLPYRGFRVRAQYPSSYNLLNGDVATGGEVTPLSAGATSSLVGSFYATPIVAASGSAWQGTQVWQVSVGASASVPHRLFFAATAGVQPLNGKVYTWTIQVRSVTTGANPVVQPIIQWVNVSGFAVQTDTAPTVTLTGSPSAAWTTITFTSTMPTTGTKVAAVVALNLTTAPTPAWVFQADGLQWEQSSSASVFSIPGTNYPVYSGMVERYPQSWEFNGTYGIVQPVCVDTMALLSQTILKEVFVMDVVATSPAWFFQLNEASNATSFSEQGGRLSGMASIFSASLGGGVLTSGNPINAASGASGKFYGTNGPVVTVNNTGTPNHGTVIDLTTAGSTIPSSGAWTRMIAFRTGQSTGAAPTFANYSAGISPGAVGYNGNMYFGLSAVSGSNWSIGASFYNNAGQQLGVATTPIINDNNWHLAFIQMSADGKTITAWVEAVSGAVTGANDMHSTISVNDSIGGDAYKLDGTANFGGSSPFNGDLALYAQWNRLLTSTEIGNLNSSFKTAYNGDSTDQRYNRILGWAGYQGNVTLDNGVTRQMTYANDIAGVDALSALQAVVNTEGGRHFAGNDGVINFQSRQRYFQQGTSNFNPIGPMWVFGENQGSGEIPYTEISFDYDPTRVANQVAVTQNSSSQVFNANDTTSQQNYGIRNLGRSSQSTNSDEVRAQSFFLLSRYKSPQLRIRSLKINVSGNPALFPSVLSFEIGQYVQVNRRDPFGLRPTVSMFGFIEQINHSGNDKGAWGTDLEISPASSVPYATFTSLRTTLNSSAAAGQPTITINALADAAINPVRSQLTGGQLMFVSGGGNGEFQTIATGGVQDALAGYSTATVTFTANLASTYPAGSAVVEFNGASFDSLAAFDNVQFSY